MAEDIPICPPPDASPHSAGFEVPPGVTDCHAHVFGPESRYPYQANRAYTPRDAPLSALRALHGVLGVRRCVLVQASAHGTDNNAILDSIAQDPANLRGVCAISEDTSDDELERLNAAGIRGFRVNLVDKGGMPFRSFDALAQMSQRVARFGWHVEFLVHVEQAIDDLRQLTKTIAVPMSVGHVGYTHARSGGEAHSGFQEFLALLRDGHFWVKLTAPYRISAEEAPPYADIRSMAEAVIEAAPGRTIWGSDWPHVIHYRTMPNDGDLFDLLAEWAPDADLRTRILVDNPGRLYGFS
jgi:2-pyrone-4,6-dicarboxylate lactonase